MAFGMFLSGLSVESGSLLNVSRPAPAMELSLRASARAFSLISPPRATLISIAVGFMAANSSELNMFRVSADSRRCRDMTSDSRRSTFSSTYVIWFAAAHSSSGLLVHAITLMPMPCAIRASRLPMRPVPTMPSVFPLNWVSSPRGHSPARTRASISGTFRATASIRARQCSATASVAVSGVLVTIIFIRPAASRSMLSTPGPQRAM